MTSGSWSYVQGAWIADGLGLVAYQNLETDTYEFGDVVSIGTGTRGTVGTIRHFGAPARPPPFIPMQPFLHCEHHNVSIEVRITFFARA